MTPEEARRVLEGTPELAHALAAQRTERALTLVYDERRRQDGLKAAGKFGPEGFTCDDTDIYDAAKLAVLVEEVGEVSRVLCEAVHHDELDNVRLREELVQVAAVAVAWIEALE